LPPAADWPVRRGGRAKSRGRATELHTSGNFWRCSRLRLEPGVPAD
jgi:hypothetical protein